LASRIFWCGPWRLAWLFDHRLCRRMHHHRTVASDQKSSDNLSPLGRPPDSTAPKRITRRAVAAGFFSRRH
jgi:hypothetical protein